MFTLGGDAFPSDTSSLLHSLASEVEARGARADAVRIEGAFPSLETVQVDLTAVRLDTTKTSIAGSGSKTGGFFSRTLKVSAQPALFTTVPVTIHLRGEDCTFAFGTASDGKRVASLEGCSTGKMTVSAPTSEINDALLVLAKEAASAHGADVKSVQLTLVSENPRTLGVHAVAVAKAMFLTATLTIRGRAVLDDDFNLQLRDATCTGDGMLANLAAAQLRARIEEMQARTFSLRTLLPPGLQPREVEMSGGDSLQIRATFGGNASDHPGK